MADRSSIVRAAYVRTASTAVAVYEYFRMFPFAISFYTVQWQSKRVSSALILFILIRITSIVLLIVSNYAFFYPNFTLETCSKYYLAAPIVKVLQIMVSQCIMGLRAYNLSGRSKRMGVVLLTLYTSICVLQWLSVLYNPHPAFLSHERGAIDIRTTCLLVATEHGLRPWVFYAVAIVFDFLVAIICGYYLVKYKRRVRTMLLSHLIFAMIYDGLAYFAGLTATNIANLIFMRSSKSSVELTV